MAVVTVDQTQLAVEDSGFGLGAYAVNRFLRMGMTPSEKAAAVTLMADAVDVIAYHWSGGYRNASPSTQVWGQSDFAPTSMATARDYATHGNRVGLDFAFANLDALIAERPNAKMVLVMHDFPEAMVPGYSRTTGTFTTPWPASTYWGASYAGQLCDEIIARYPGKILAFSYGQELKGLTNRTSTGQLDAFAAGFTAWATYMQANHPTIERWYPHLNLWATHSTNAQRQTAVDALLAGGSALGPWDDFVLNRLMDQVDESLVDRMTYDCSIIDHGAGDTWRGNYSAVAARTDLEYHVARVWNAKMHDRWGVVKPLVAIESYFDVNQGIADWATTPQQAALSTAIAMGAARAGVTYHMRWDPQGAVPGQESPTGDLASWWDLDGVALPAWAQIRDLANMVAGEDIYVTTSDNASIKAIAAGTRVYILNLSGSAISTSVTATDGTIAAQDIPAYGYVIEDLPGDPVPDPDPPGDPDAPGPDPDPAEEPPELPPEAPADAGPKRHNVIERHRAPAGSPAGLYLRTTGVDDRFELVELEASIGGGMVPYFIAAAETFTVPEFRQALYAMTIDVEGTLDVAGALLEVD